MGTQKKQTVIIRVYDKYNARIVAEFNSYKKFMEYALVNEDVFSNVNIEIRTLKYTYP